MSLRDTILAKRQRNVELLEVPEWGVTVGLQAPTVRERTEALSHTMNDDGTVDQSRFQVATMICTVVDPENGQPLFGWDDVDVLSDLEAGPVARVFLRAQPLLGFTDEAVEDAKGN